MKTIYLLKKSATDDGSWIIAAFDRESDRDAAWEAIQAIPWLVTPNPHSHEPDIERAVFVGADTHYERKAKWTGSTIYRAELQVREESDGPIEVLDVTNREP